MDSNYYRARIQNALEFIDEHLAEPINVADIAQAAAFSEFHFHRLFPAYVGEPIHQYVRTRRLEKAARILKKDPQTRLLDLALEVGFETHSAFSRAFKQHYGLSPSQLKKDGHLNGRELIPHFPDHLKKPTIPLRAYITQQPDRYLLYRVLHGRSSGSFFADYVPYREFAALQAQSPPNLCGLSSAFPQPPEGLNDPIVPVWYGGVFDAYPTSTWSENCQILEGGRWAVFDYEGAHKFLHQAWNQIYRSWLPNSGRKLRHALPFEMYRRRSQEAGGKHWPTQIWIPIC